MLTQENPVLTQENLWVTQDNFIQSKEDKRHCVDTENSQYT